MPPEEDLRAIDLVTTELVRARRLYPDQTCPHQSYAILLEEMDEFWDEVKLKRKDRSQAIMCRELKQIGAMAIRAMVDLHLLPTSSGPDTPPSIGLYDPDANG